MTSELEEKAPLLLGQQNIKMADKRKISTKIITFFFMRKGLA